MIVTCVGFDRIGNTDAYAAPHGRRALCRFGPDVVNATIDGPESLRCVTPPSMEGAVRAHVSVSINGVDFVGLPAAANPARAEGVGVGSHLQWHDQAMDHSGYGGGVGGGLGDSGEAAHEAAAALSGRHGGGGGGDRAAYAASASAAHGSGSLTSGRDDGNLVVFTYYEHPLLTRVSPVGGPILGMTSVTLSASRPLPVRDWTLLRCRFGASHEVPLTAIARAAKAEGATAASSKVAAVVAGLAVGAMRVDLGKPGQVICLSPPHGYEDDLEVTLTLNGQQARPPSPAAKPLMAILLLSPTSDAL